LAVSNNITIPSINKVSDETNSKKNNIVNKNTLNNMITIIITREFILEEKEKEEMIWW
jgi:hypothetical protein